MTQTRNARNYRKNPHTARFLMAFHAGTNGLPSDIEETVEVIEDLRTEAQINLMDRLIEQLAALDSETGRKAARYTDGMSENGKWTAGRGGNASAWISRMIAKVRELEAAAPATGATELEDGIYLLDGQIIKVVHAVHGSGRQYGKRLDVTSGTWERVSGVISKLTPAHKVSLADAAKFGKIYGVCINCGRTLTDEASIAAGIGPVCASRF